MNPYHEKLLQAVLLQIGHDTLVLKGGTALIFAYKLNRTSHDLDFDSVRKVKDLEFKIRKTQVPDIRIVGIDLIKNTPTVTRYRVRYESPLGEDSLKIEISHRDHVIEEEINIIDGIRVASIERILDQKLRAAYDGEHPRTKARDLVDLDFIASEYPAKVTKQLAERLQAFAADPEILRSQYAPAFDEDNIEADCSEICLRLSANAESILKAISKTELGRGGGR